MKKRRLRKLKSEKEDGVIIIVKAEEGKIVTGFIKGSLFDVALIL